MIKINDYTIEFEKFPNGETRINGTDLLNAQNANNNTITLKYENDNDLIRLMLVKRFLDERSFGDNIQLKILYMPYSRMDRVEGNSVFTLKYVSEFINSLGFSRVFIIEPHSDVTPALIDKSIADYPTIHQYLPKVISKIKFNKDADYLFFPDGGAQKRYGNIKGFNQLVGNKKRNFKTGRIESLEVVGDMKPGQKIVIVDDLSSYGGTFMMSGQKLKDMGAAEVYLLVAHCENSIFDGDIFKTNEIDGVFTTNSILDQNKTHEKLHIIN
ncbi:ribose-phosphate pyrophosphokinase [Bacillus pacificus]|nr:ribose-phosphate pyrophosphokinase [Bacillus pacificus]